MTDAQIAALRERWLDQTVTVRPRRSDLMRFEGRTGTVKAVNFNGHCLVQFDAGQDVSWYDLAPSDLTAIEQPTDATNDK